MIKCPKCQSTDTLPIKYGYPSEEMEAARARGEIVLGGCRPQRFNRCCRACGHGWEIKEEEDED